MYILARKVTLEKFIAIIPRVHFSQEIDVVLALMIHVQCTHCTCGRTCRVVFYRLAGVVGMSVPIALMDRPGNTFSPLGFTIISSI